MDYANSIWQVGVIALVAGVLIGALVYRLFAPSVRQADEVKSELNQAREELDKYRASVDDHFQKTSELVNELTQDYVKVYQHLAEGAQALGDSKHFNNLLEQQKGKVLISVDESQSEPEVIDREPLAAAAVDPEAAAKPDEHAEAVVEAQAEATETRTNGGEAPQADAATEAPRAPAGTGEAIIDTAKLEAEAEKADADKVEGDAAEAEKPAVAEQAADDSAKNRPVSH